MAKVALIACDSYEPEQVYVALKKGIALLGGIEKFVKPKERILMKPNLLRAKKAENAVTTHPSVMEALIRILKEADCNNLFYGDSPGIGSPEKVAEESGIKAVADRYNVDMLEFSKGKTVAYPEGKMTKQFELAEAVLETDAIISLPKMKTHGLTRITGAIKNQLGCVYGLNKSACHSRYPSPVDFSKMLVDLNLFLKPRLYIMDGIVAMEGNGPASGTPTPMNLLLVSDDPVALDSTFARLVDLDPSFLPFITSGEAMGLGKSKEEEIEILGERLEDHIHPQFNVERLPVKDEMTRLGQLSKVRGLLVRKPVIKEKRCVQCGICISACPLEEKALSWQQTAKGRLPVYDYHKCIRCYCCQEMCPQKAITVKTPLLGRLLIYR